MKFCCYCGNEMHDEAVICVKCGRSVVVQQPTPMMQQQSMPMMSQQPMPMMSQTPVKQEDNTLAMVVKIFLILGCISQGWLVVPLAWCLPITISIFNRFKDGRPIGMGLKICTLLFVNLIAGICLLCMNDDI